MGPQSKENDQNREDNCITAKGQPIKTAILNNPIYMKQSCKIHEDKCQGFELCVSCTVPRAVYTAKRPRQSSNGSLSLSSVRI